MGAVKEAFLIHRAVKDNVPSPTQNYAPGAIVLIYWQISRDGFGWLPGRDRAETPASLPLVFTRYEERAVLAHLDGARCVMTSLFYGFWLLRADDGGFDRHHPPRLRLRRQAPL